MSRCSLNSWSSWNQQIIKDWMGISNFLLARCSLFILQKLCRTQHAIIIWLAYGIVKLRHLRTFQLFLRLIQFSSILPLSLLNALSNAFNYIIINLIKQCLHNMDHHRIGKINRNVRSNQLRTQLSSQFLQNRFLQKFLVTKMNLKNE